MTDHVAVLRQFACGERGHLYRGSCPDPIEGFNSRDPECPVCQAIEALASAPSGGEVVLPCDVRLPPATTITAGCKLSTLLSAIELRRENGIVNFPGTAPPSAPVGVGLASALQSMRDRMMTALPPKFGGAFDGDFDTLLEAINALKAGRGQNLAALAQQPAPSAPVPPNAVVWHPIETAPKDNKRPLYLAQFNTETGDLIDLDWDASWEPESESWEIPQVYYVWRSANGRVEEPTHWAYQGLQEPAACVGCEGKPAPENSPCAVCGQQPAAVDGERGLLDAKVVDSLIVANEETHAVAKDLAACLADAVAAGATDIPLTHRAGGALKRYEELAAIAQQAAHD